MAETVKKAKAPAKPRKTTANGKTAEGKTAEFRKAAADGRAVTHEQIAHLAHRYWAERGYPHGQAEQDWYRAEQELRGKAS